MLFVAGGDGDFDLDGTLAVVYWAAESAGEGFADLERGEDFEGERDSVWFVSYGCAWLCKCLVKRESGNEKQEVWTTR